MRRILAGVIAMLMGLSVPAFAQTPGSSPANQGPVQGPSPVGGTQGTDAFGQAPPPSGLDDTTLLIGGGLLIGAGVLTAVVVNNNKSGSTTSNPTSP